MTRQNLLLIKLSGLSLSKRPIQLKMFPGEVKKFKKVFPELTLEIKETMETRNSKMYLVNITCTE